MDTNEIITLLKNKHDSLQVGLEPYQMCIREGIVLYCAPESKLGFEFFCFRSPGMVTELNYFIDHAKGKKCFLDIGSADGIFSLVFAKLNKDSSSHAIEPSPKLFSTLAINTQYQPILIHNIAFSDNTEAAPYYKEWEHIVFGEPTQDWINGGTETGIIGCVKGDDFCIDNNIRPDICKIDVEGAELKVIKGLFHVLDACRPVVFLELHIGRMYKDLPELRDIIYGMDYKIIDTETGQEMSLFTLRDTDPDKRLILIP